MRLFVFGHVCLRVCLSVVFGICLLKTSIYRNFIVGMRIHFKNVEDEYRGHRVKDKVITSITKYTHVATWVVRLRLKGNLLLNCGQLCRVLFVGFVDISL